jgi:hypothetical protein
VRGFDEVFKSGREGGRCEGQGVAHYECHQLKAENGAKEGFELGET